MARITIETALSNSDYGGVEKCSEQTQAASSRELVIDMLEWMLEDLPPMTDEERGSVQVVGCEFVEADSAKLHGSCYFDVTLEVADSLKAKLEA